MSDAPIVNIDRVAEAIKKKLFMIDVLPEMIRDKVVKQAANAGRDALIEEYSEWPVRARWVKFSDRFPDDNIGVVMRKPEGETVAGSGGEDWLDDDAECFHVMATTDFWYADKTLIEEDWAWLEVVEGE